jgi:multimeric flavodoxin WrbA
MKKNNNTEKKYLLLSTLPKDTTAFDTVYNELRQHISNLQAVSTNGMIISHCIGCNDCWIKTPGLCCIKDDYGHILIKMLQADCVIFLTETKLGFVCSQMKNMVDRILPLATMYLKFKDGQMRHYSRYNKQPDMALLYTGSADNDYLNLWLGRVQINLHGRSLGAYEIDDREKLYNELDNY